MSNTPKITQEMQLGNKGEAYLEVFLSDYCLTHKIAGSKDIGIDLFSEWIYGGGSTSLLFAIQIKTLSKPKVALIQDKSKNNNRLDSYEISRGPSIKDSTYNYWRKYEIPIFLFVLIPNTLGVFDCYYKRITPILHKDIATEEKSATKQLDMEKYYKVSSTNNKFLAFSDVEQGGNSGGFTRDLFIDYIRCNYYKGSLSYRNPRELGLGQFPKQNNIFPDLANEYKSHLKTTHKALEQLKVIGIFDTNKKTEADEKLFTDSQGRSSTQDELLIVGSEPPPESC